MSTLVSSPSQNGIKMENSSFNNSNDNSYLDQTSQSINGIKEELSSQSFASQNGNGTTHDDDDDEDETPWGARIEKSEPKEEAMEEEDDDKPWGERVTTEIKEEVSEASTSTKKDKKKKKKETYEEEEEEYVPEPRSSKKKKKDESDEDEYVPEKKKKEVSKVKHSKKRKTSDYESEEEEDDYKPEKKKKKTTVKHEVKTEKSSRSKSGKVEKEVKKQVKTETTETSSGKKKKKTEEEEEVWKWWEEEKKGDGIKWNSLEHKGPLFAPPYEPLPKNVHFKYDGKEMSLSEPAEEVATFYARMLDHDYVTKPIFNKNFFHDWRKVMTPEEKEKIVDLSKCNFRQIHAHFMALSEKRKAMTKEEKQKIKEENAELVKEYGYAIVDGHKQKIGNFRIEPPGLFRGRGDHPKMGKLKRRIRPEDVIINCSKGNEPAPPEGHKWKEIRHDNTVTWLCGWSENVLGSNKYIMLNPSSKIKGEKDYEKFETARKLKSQVGQIRQNYNADLKAREMRVRQRAVALYFIDKLALRAGNEKDTDEAADTVGCCSLRVEHIKLHDQKEVDGEMKQYVVAFDFLGKDSIRYLNEVPVDKQVYKNVKLFMENKEPKDDLFDRLDTPSLNAHLKTLMPGLTAKVFRTYNASITLQQQLDKLTEDDMSMQEKLLAYNRANRQVAILCNHQRSVPKSHEKSMENLKGKIKDKKKEVKQLKEELKNARGKDKEKAQSKLARAEEQLKKLRIQRTDRDENKTIALGTSKLNYLDPRISVAWCRKQDVPIDKIFNKTQRDKFRWAIDMADEDYVF